MLQPEEFATRGDVLRRAVSMMGHAGIDDARLDAELMLAAACGVSRAALLTGVVEPDTAAIERFEAMLLRRVVREPLAYIIGRREFYSMEFAVTPEVLIPRPETELLVDQALEFIARKPEGCVLDIGTGSGAIAIAIAANAPGARIVATDVSENSLAIARANAMTHRCADRIEFVRTDLFPPRTDAFDVILSNPPYVPSRDIDSLAPEVRLYEPRHALDGGEDGLDFYRKIIPDCRRYLAPDGVVAFEVGMDQADGVAAMFTHAGFRNVTAFNDLSAIPRVVRASGLDF